MTVLAAQTYLKTRTDILAARLFSDDQLEDFSRRSLDALGKSFDLSELLQRGLPPDQINRAAERSLIQTLMLDLSVLLRPLDGIGRATLIRWSHKFELYNLKAIIRGKLQGLGYDQINRNLHDLPPLISLPHDELVRTEDILELLRRLESGPYSDIAFQARRVYKQRNEPFSLDATIDQRYYTGLLRRARGVDEKDRTPLLSLIGVMIDQQNLTWLARYRFYYGLSPSETYYLLIPFGHHLHRDLLAKLAELDKLSEVVSHLPETLALQLQNIDTPMGIEQALSRETSKKARHSLKHDDSAVTKALAYLVLREMDLKKLYAMIQGKILGLDDALIRSVIGFDDGSAVDEATGGADNV